MEMTQEEFLTDVKYHNVNIVQAYGSYRHIRYRRKDTSNLWFDIITWPMHLCIAGDMGTYVFAKINDMFDFFRNKDNKINIGYWHEKLVSDSRFEGSKKFSKDLLESNVKDIFMRACIHNEIPINKRKEVWTDLKHEVLCSENGYEAHKSAYYFNSNGFALNDFFEVDLDEYTYHFIWCLRAIVWGINKFDLIKEEKNAY